jgi:predicted transcriptional regulator
VAMRGLGDLEAVIMDTMWTWGRPSTVRDVFEFLHQQRVIAYTTVMTVMDNLHRKGLLERDLDGRAYRYRPVWSREEYSARLMREALSSSEDRAATLVHFLEQMDPVEAVALQQALRQIDETSP